ENQQSPYALLLIDVDKFKHVNDTWGHQFGDNVLARVAQVLTKNLDTHSIYRIGGDEFAALVPVNDDAPLGEQLNRLVLDMRHQKWREQGCHVTLSIGVSIGPNTPCELVNHADKALYRSKENGRDCWSMA
ncbi:GGDEF domain-containing protein, partial [Vibrio diabolicus]|nr:GGDEF domain-containing protein [Vibrio diabolicus]